MEKYAWKARILDGQIDEYKRRHREIWPEMVAALKSAGIQNYSIWLIGNTVFGYYECENGKEYAAKIQKESPVVDQWNLYMKDVMVMDMDPKTGAQPLMQQVWDFN